MGCASDHISMWTRQTRIGPSPISVISFGVALLRMFSKRYYRPVGAEPAVGTQAHNVQDQRDHRRIGVRKVAR